MHTLREADMRATHKLKTWVFAAFFATWLYGCGGGGPGSQAQAAPATPPPTGTVPPPVQPSNEFAVYVDVLADSLLKGALDSSSWSRIAEFKSGRHSLTPLAAGRQLAVYQAQDAQNTGVSVYDVRSGQPLWSQVLPRNTVVEAGPVFGNASHYLLRTITGTSDGNKAFVVDLRAGSIVSTFASGGLDYQYATLPDGRLYRVSKQSGALAIGSADGTWATVGNLTIPAGLHVMSWRINHRGDRLAVVYALSSPGTFKTDVWVARIDGSGQYRLTDLGHAGAPVWSPDDSRLAFTYETLSDAVGGLPGSATGQCSTWYAAGDSRSISGLVNGQPHAIARQMKVNYSGIKDHSTCDIVAWEAS